MKGTARASFGPRPLRALARARQRLGRGLSDQPAVHAELPGDPPNRPHSELVLAAQLLE